MTSNDGTLRRIRSGAGRKGGETHILLRWFFIGCCGYTWSRPRLCRAVRLVPLSSGGGRQREEQEASPTNQQEPLSSRQSKRTVVSTTSTTSASSTVKPAESPDDHLVSDLLPLWIDPDQPFPTRHWAGHLPASSEDDKYLFYWLFEPPTQAAEGGDSDNSSKNNNGTIPLVIWLNGGPGCSSMDGLWLENGPFRLVLRNETASGGGNDPKYRVAADPHSWHLAPAYTLYIDQPVGTGLSFTVSGTYPNDDVKVNVDFYHFLQSFFRLYASMFVAEGENGQEIVNRPVYFSGESHAGHYIPSMMNYILGQNDDNDGGRENKIIIPLSGAAIGNGWMDPYYQYAAAEAAYGKGLIGRSQWHALDLEEKKCQDQLGAGVYGASVCFDLLSAIVDGSYGTSLPYRVSTYDARRSEPKHGSRTFPPGHKVVETYLGGWDLDGNEPPGSLDPQISKQVLTTIHAEAAAAAGQVYQECTNPPYNALSHQDGKGVVPDIVAVLEHPSKPRLLFFNGIEDLICNHVGNEKMLEKLPWKGKEGWIEASRYAWKAASEPDGQVSGYMKEHENLGFLKILNAGHMVPMDVPAVGLEMMQIFIYGKSFDMSKQSLENSAEVTSCPACSTCPTCQDCSEADDHSSSHSDNTACEPCPADTIDDRASTTDGNNASGATSGGTSLGNGVLAGLVGAAFVLGGSLVYVIVGNRAHNSARTLVPQYDLEMRRRDGYADVPENGFA